MLSDNLIITITKKADSNFRNEMLQSMNKLFDMYEINTTLRITHFLAQAMHESGDFSINIENLNYSTKGLLGIFRKYFDEDLANEYARNPQRIANRVYANRLGNGDEDSNDGWTYRGRGIFQLTGRANYRKYGEILGIDLERNTELARDPYISLQVACEYWKSRSINQDADNDDIESVTRKINGGTNGLDDRQAHYNWLYPLVSNDVG
jgi:putative chitinase